MWKLLMLTILVLNQNMVFCSTVVARQNQATGPVSNIIENLAVHTSQVTNDLLTQLSSRIEKTSETIIGDIEVILASALEQITEPIIAAQNQIAKSECQQAFSIDELRERMETQLSACTQNLNDVLLDFQSDSEEYNKSLLNNVQVVADLPHQCENMEFSFANFITCFVEQMTAINREIAVVLNRASMAIMQTNQLAKQGAESARICAEQSVADDLDYLDKVLQNCQMK